MVDETIEQLSQEVDVQTKLRDGAPASHESFDRLIRVVWRLVQPDGCPWDRKQTHKSIAKNMIEEAYEAVDAIEKDDVDSLREELGDVLLQVVLHAQIGQKNQEFCIDDICEDLEEKLIRRHPHVFSRTAHADNAQEVLNIWDNVKDEERKSQSTQEEKIGLLDSIPPTFPALMQAQKVSKRAAKVGFDWECIDDVWDKVAEEKAEFLAEPKGSAQAEEEFGDLLFALVNVARMEGIDAEGALRKATAKFRGRFASMEAEADKQGSALSDMSFEKLNELWDLAKIRD